jgi:hypothetical protein
MDTKLGPYEEIAVEFDEGYLQIFGSQLAKQIGMPNRLSYGRWKGEGPRKEFFPYIVPLEDLKKLKQYHNTIFRVINPYTMARRTSDGGLELMRTCSRKTETFKGIAKLSKWEYQTIEAFL